MRKGFTLVELLIVLAVIAALMAVATPLALNAVRNAKASQVAQNLRNIKAAYEQYVSVEKELPDSLNKLKTYLSTMPNNYEVDFPTSFTTGVATATIVYSGGDVTAQDVSKYLSEATSLTVNGKSGPGIKVTVRQWW